ncbi:MAG: Asp-tRNA(Asn)/Glu-tRNA(Gln) amidotransferase subunit GatC [Acidobacteriota bacterium]|nr:Asp-tRNA(Asn)/Glu-tRNA(Gln) amidotransferase subunit GatC [Acidobacteriota bacterium]
MPLTREDAARVAALARLAMTDAELDRAAVELGAILGHFEQIAAVDTSDVDPAPAAAARALRGDDPRPSLAPGQTFANAPDADRDAGLFRVPRVLGS